MRRNQWFHFTSGQLTTVDAVAVKNSTHTKHTYTSQHQLNKLFLLLAYYYFIYIYALGLIPALEDILLAFRVERIRAFHRASSEEQWRAIGLSPHLDTIESIQRRWGGASAPLLLLYTIEGGWMILAGTSTYITHSTRGKKTSSSQGCSLLSTRHFIVTLVEACCCAGQRWHHRLAGKEWDLGACSPCLRGWSQGTLLWLLCRRGSGGEHRDRSSWGPSTSSLFSWLPLAVPLLSAS